MVPSPFVDTLIVAAGVAYPGYRTFKALQSAEGAAGSDPAAGTPAELKRWLRHWAVMAFFRSGEKVSDRALWWAPFYQELKLAFVLVLVHAQGGAGAGHLYSSYLAPFLARHEGTIDRLLEAGKARARELGAAAWRTVREAGRSQVASIMAYAHELQRSQEEDERRAAAAGGGKDADLLTPMPYAHIEELSPSTRGGTGGAIPYIKASPWSA